MEPEKGSSAYFERLEERIADALLEKDGKSDYDPDLWGEGIDESDLWVN
jgi:hypothetical protein